MSRKIAAAWRSRWASRRRIFSPRSRFIRPMSWWPPRPGTAASRPRADAIVTRTEGLAIGVTAADCGPILFVDPNARVIGAAHAGWKGALTGILESTIDAMEKLGAERSRHRRRDRPIDPPAQLRSRRRIRRAVHRGRRRECAVLHSLRASGHAMFDLAGFIRMRLENAGVLMIDDVGVDTYSDERFYSYRRSVHRERAGLRPPRACHRAGARISSSNSSQEQAAVELRSHERKSRASMA